MREVNARVHWKGLELLRGNQMLFEDDTALVADSEEKFCSPVSEIVRACERRIRDERGYE